MISIADVLLSKEVQQYHVELKLARCCLFWGESQKLRSIQGFSNVNAEPCRPVNHINTLPQRHTDVTRQRVGLKSPKGNRKPKKNIRITEPVQHFSDTGHEPTLSQTNNSKWILNASANERKKTLLMLSLASTKDKSLASKVNYNAARGQNLCTKL